MNSKNREDITYFFIALSLLLLLISHTTETMSEDRIKIGIIDSGISIEQSKSKILCDGGLKSIATTSLGYDHNGHGTNIFGLVSQGLNPRKYCIISYKVWADYSSSKDAVDYTITSIENAIKDDVKFLNISMSGDGSSVKEYKTIKTALKTMSIFVAAGNDGKEIGGECSIYPACYKRFFKKNLYVIGSYKAESSNYGEYVDYFTYGERMGNPILSGTSQATAYFTNNFIKKSYKNVVYTNRSLNVRFNFFRTTTGK
jgi:hypothetical protein